MNNTTTSTSKASAQFVAYTVVALALTWVWVRYIDQLYQPGGDVVGLVLLISFTAFCFVLVALAFASHSQEKREKQLKARIEQLEAQNKLLNDSYGWIDEPLTLLYSALQERPRSLNHFEYLTWRSEYVANNGGLAGVVALVNEGNLPYTVTAEMDPNKVRKLERWVYRHNSR